MHYLSEVRVLEELKGERTAPDNAVVISKEIVVRIMDNDANIHEGVLNLRIWE